MVKILTIGVLSVQGAISEHLTALQRLLTQKHMQGHSLLVRNTTHLEQIDALVIPGGESTTISKMLLQSGMYKVLSRRIQNHDLPILGTCAGCVLLAKKIVDDASDVHLLEAMDICVERNAFGRQKQSFEKEIDFNGFKKPFNAVFIRAPIIREVWGDNSTVLAEVDKKIVAVRQNNLLALSFHPELTDDLRIHEYFLEMIL